MHNNNFVHSRTEKSIRSNDENAQKTTRFKCCVNMHRRNWSGTKKARWFSLFYLCRHGIGYNCVRYIRFPIFTIISYRTRQLSACKQPFQGNHACTCLTHRNLSDSCVVSTCEICFYCCLERERERKLCNHDQIG